ncbi:peptidoglycan DD-metalloendopeptidase family protein [Patescibacteria group bacterium AH-259-L07]|nr:peptidoglycan DD-metalloendopeptidase family protein [Patescibacteria group bacterium AH-259-L07]
MRISNLEKSQYTKIAYSEHIFRHSLTIFTIVAIVIFILLIISGSIIVNKRVHMQIAPVASTTQNKESISARAIMHIIKPGEAFSNIGASLGFTAELTQEILESAEDTYDLANIKAGNRIQSFFNSETDEFEKMIYHIDEDSFLEVEKISDGLAASKNRNKYDIEVTRVSGTIEDSLYMAGINLGLEDKTIMEMADIFAWDIDFGLEVRAGDTFDVLYEKRFLKGKEVSPGKVLLARYKSENNEYWAVYFKDPEENEDYYDLNGKNLRRQFLRSPVHYKYISSGFSYKRLHPVWRIYTPHLAIDYAAATGTPVQASGAGTVIFTGWKKCIGQTIIIRHNDVYTTRYSHVSSYAKGIYYGAKVTQGQVIGFVGSTGSCSTGPHLEYGMEKYGQAVNPLLQKFDKAEPIPRIYKDNFEFYKDAILKLFNK